MHRTSSTLRLKALVTAACLAGLGVSSVVGAHPVQASTTASTTPLVNGGFEQGVPQSAWTETQSSGGELIDNVYPHTGAWAADLCDIDSCNDGHGNAGDSLAQSVVSPGQVLSARLSYSYSIATSEPNQNSACHDWLTVGMGVGRAPDATATKRYCASTATQYVSDSIDVTGFLNSHGGQTVATQIAGYTDGINPSQFFVDDVSLAITYLTTPSAPAVAAITDCGVGQTNLTWSAPQFPLGGVAPVQSYLVTPYSVSGSAQPSITVAGSQNSLPVNLHNGTVCYFTVTATNANGTGPPGSPAVPVAAVTPLTVPAATGFSLHWSLQPASAPATSYTVFIRDGTGPWLTWTTTPGTSSAVYGRPGHSYQYYVEALTAAGGGIPPSGSGQTSVTVPSSAVPAMGLKSLYGVDAYGFLHPADSPPLAQPSTWTWQIARGIATNPAGTGGYVVDGFGGVHAIGDAPSAGASAYWPGWDIARGIALRPDGVSGYVLDGFGGIHPFGGAPSLTVTAYWSGWDIARGIVLDSTGAGGYVLDGFGGIHQFGDARQLNVTAYWANWDIARGIALRADGNGGYVLDGFGGVHAVGGAPALTIRAYWAGWDVARSIVLLPSGGGGYVGDALGGFSPLGSVTSGADSPNYSGAVIVRGAAGS